jgi:hypothetical protein
MFMHLNRGILSRRQIRDAKLAKFIIGLIVVAGGLWWLTEQYRITLPPEVATQPDSFREAFHLLWTATALMFSYGLAAIAFCVIGRFVSQLSWLISSRT